MIINQLADDLEYVLERTENLWSDLRGGRILITGATGFFGCWLLETFSFANRRLNLRAEAVALSRRPERLRESASHLATDPAIRLHAADVRDQNFPRETYSHVIHAATEANVPLNIEMPMLMFDTIVSGTRHTLEFAQASSVRRFLFVSSGAIYGKQPPELTHVPEWFTGGPDPLAPDSAYAEGKRAAETLCAATATTRLGITMARCFAFVGPYMQVDTHFAIGNFIADALRGGPIHVKGDGSAFRSYLYASDLAVWLWTILFRGESRRAYNVGSEDAVNIRTIANEVSKAALGKVGVRVAQKLSDGTQYDRYVPSTKRAREELGLRCEIPLQEAIRRTYNWFAAKQGGNPGVRTRGAHV